MVFNIDIHDIEFLCGSVGPFTQITNSIYNKKIPYSHVCCIYVCLYIDVHIQIYWVHIYVYMYIYIYIHKHTRGELE